MGKHHGNFSRVAANYRLYRPHYPPELIERLQVECNLLPTHVVADIGSGTGLLTELFLKNGNRVFAVEPDAEMRRAAEEDLGANPLFTSIAATAEATTLEASSVDMITVGQAFHWFNHDAARQEFLRILVPKGWVALVYNLERNDGSAFGDAFEAFWRTYLDPNAQFNERRRPDYITRFFEGGELMDMRLDNFQVCDFDSLKGRILSASRSPQAGDPEYAAMVDDLIAIFNQHQDGGTVTLDYETLILYGQVA
jgi:ubiquinone/menaquinone biosynthesis C-methylase UbiE